MPSAEPLIHVRNLRFRYPGASQDTLHIAALDISGKGLIALTGPSGAGKSTLIELLAGTLREPYEGTVQVLGAELRDLTRDADRQRHIRRVGLIPQDYGLLPGRTIEEILRQDLSDAQVPKEEHAARIEKALAQVGLSEFAQRASERLSGGQRQRVAIARMLARDVDLVIADEPTANLDPQLVGETLDLFRELAARVPVIIVTHDGQVAERCNRTIVLQPAVTGEPSTLSSGVRQQASTFNSHRHLVAASVVGVVLLVALAGGVAVAFHRSPGHPAHAGATVARSTPTPSLPSPVPTQPRPTATPALSAAPTLSDPNRPAGIWCPVINGEMPPVPGCELYPSPPTLASPPNSEPVIAGTPVGPTLGSNGTNATSGTMHDPWAVNAGCAGADAAIRVTLETWTAQAEYYSWGDIPCEPQPTAPYYGYEFRRIANVPVQMTVVPETGNVFSWWAQLLQR